LNVKGFNKQSCKTSN